MNSKKIVKLTDSLNDNLFQFAKFDRRLAKKSGYSNYSYWGSTFRVFSKNKVAVFFLFILVILLTFTIIQPYLPNQMSPIEIAIDPDTNMQFVNHPPGKEFLFGTNSIGQDLWSRIWSGTRTSLLIGILVGVWEAIIGIIIGSLWGYIRSLDRIITEIYNVFNNIPTTIIMVLLTYIMKPSIGTLIFAMCITGWIGMARFIRNQIIIIRDREYNLASKTLGTSITKIILKNLLPYLVSVIMLRMALAIPAAIGSEVFLTYIGLGLPINIPSLGNLINEGRGVMMNSTLRYQLIFPSIILSIITISFYIIGNVFADAADPKNHI
ncbi:ABC transporter permease [Tissierella creatinophila]|uniref:Dipeptide transport system permease protein DppC n=1 Tax=Tissierella creatinophila DSM 6911 TaxID=1123403 RepID=A0A1U7M6B2_TISCR|nr:ABC transporter permease [Tissierella creatinophila]OLS02815.1 dipeptide transport system permease protein DppC [Tissierella creatinophila DSM 6911]